MSWRGWQEVVGVIGIFVLLTTVITVTIWQLAVTWRAKALLAREDEYRRLAEKSAASQESTERHLAEIQTRLQSLERILKDVE